METHPQSWDPRAQLAIDTLAMKPCKGIPAWMVHVMDPAFIEMMTHHSPGDFAKDPDGVYIEFQDLCGVGFIDQYLASNVLAMTQHGYASGTEKGATGGAERIVQDGIEIDSPDAVIEHLEKFVWPRRQAQIDAFAAGREALIAKMIDGERDIQRMLGNDILKGPYSGGFQSMPNVLYGWYGYANYFMAYALYPEVMEKDFAQQADLATLANDAAVEAINHGGLPRLIRLDHDIADSRGTLMDVRSIDRLWMPHFRRCIDPFLRAGVRLIWHCDGNLMAMVPRLIEAGIGGFQGFQYEDGMDYEKICRMKDRDGNGLFIIGGVSVTRTLPFGAPDDVKKEMKFLVDNGPKTGLMLGLSSSCAPGTSWDNIRTCIDGLRYYREHGRS